MVGDLIEGHARFFNGKINRCALRPEPVWGLLWPLSPFGVGLALWACAPHFDWIPRPKRPSPFGRRGWPHQTQDFQPRPEGLIGALRGHLDPSSKGREGKFILKFFLVYAEP
jgi:hypothetical protein